MEVFSTVVLSMFPIISCFNFDTKHAIVYKNPDIYDEQSYFGYSIILYPKNGSSRAWVQIAAPKGMDHYSNDVRSGVIYRCSIGDGCSNLYIANAASQWTPSYTYGWVGNAMDIDYNSNKCIICAYRWFNVARDDYSTHKIRGKCFWSSLDQNEYFHTLNPLEKSDLPYSSFGQAGFSAHISKRQSEPEILLGAPGIDNWRGIPIIYKHSRGAKTVHPNQRGSVIFAEFGILNTAITANHLFHAFDLLGYCVSSGYFYDPNELVYVAGAPKANRYFGRVLIFKYNDQKSLEIVMSLSAIDPQFGEYFGASVAVGDFNNDGLDDLIVGAPYYANKGFNQGRVLLYLGSNDFTSQEKFVSPIRASISGKLSGGQFGFAVSALGDIDLDSFCDVAVAAPYADEGRGIVYIYRGSKSGLNTEPSQIIKAREIDGNLRAFGSTFSKAIDIDENYCDDIAIGAYKSGHAVILRSKPILTLKQIVTSHRKTLAYGDSNVTIEHCIWYMGSFLPNITHIVRHFTLDPFYQRAFLKTDNLNNIQLMEENTFCENITIFVKVTTTFLPIVIITDISLTEQPEDTHIVHIHRNHSNVDTFCSKCPIFSKDGSDIHNRLEIPFSIGCGDDNMCKSNFKIKYKFEDIVNNIFVVGENRDFLNLIVKMKNTGQKAFNTKFHVEIPESVYFANENQNGSFSVGNPLNENEERELIISLDMSRIKYGNQPIDSLKFLMNISTSSIIVDLEQAKKVAVLFIKRDADIYLTGTSEEESYFYGNSSTGHLNITQTYTIQKYGPSPIHASRLFIEVPSQLVLATNETVDILTLVTSDTTLRGLTCNTNITTISEKPQSDSTNNEFYNSQENNDEVTETPKILLKRRKRAEHTSNDDLKRIGINKIDDNDIANSNGFNMGVFNKKYNNEIANDKVIFLNCNSTNVICQEIICHVEKLVNQLDTAEYKLKILLNIGILKELLPRKDIILLSTRGDVHIDDPFNFIQTGNRSDEAIISTVILGPQPKYSVPLWIIISSILGGLLLLMFLILLLVKIGFFRRKKREELEQLKKNVEDRQKLAPPSPSVEIDEENREIFADVCLK